MRIVYLTPGTGHFHCGSCLRDEALIKVLKTNGHEVTWVPLYLPLVLDQLGGPTPPQPVKHIHLGGINAYLQQKSAVFRKTPAWINRIFDAPGLLRWVSRKSNMTNATALGDLACSLLRGEDGNQHRELQRLVKWLQTIGPMDVLCLSNALLIGLASQIRSKLAIPVVCTLQGEDVFLNSLPSPYRDECWQIVKEGCRHVNAFIAVSQYYGDMIASRLELPAKRIHVVYNGIDIDGFNPAPAPPTPPVLGYLARLCPEKGLDVIIDAFMMLKERDQIEGLRLHLVGAITGVDRKFVDAQKKRLQSAGVMDVVAITSNPTRHQKQEILRGMSVLSVPATYGEAFGLYVLEALASGVPVVQPRCGAFPELLAKTGGGILYEPDDLYSLVENIELLLLDEHRRSRLGKDGRIGVAGYFDADRMAKQFADLCSSVKTEG